MLRYIYLLCLIISFEVGFCYNYIDNHSNRRNGRRGVRKYDRDDAEIRHRNRPNYVLEDRPLAQIDVASFMQGPDDLDTPRYYGYDVKRSKQQKPRPEPAKVSRCHPPESGENLESYQHQQLVEQHLLKNPKKKNTLTKILPFFSRNKSDPERKKEDKKLFHLGSNNMNIDPLNCQQNDSAIPLEANFKMEKKATNIKRKPTIHEGIQKRYAKVLCQKCKMKLMNLAKKRGSGAEVMHNSRQYFARLSNNLKAGVRDKQLSGENVRKQSNASNGDSGSGRKRRKMKKDTWNARALSNS